MQNLRIEKLKNLSLAALLMAGAAFTACSSDDSIDEIQQPANPTTSKVYTMTVTASKGSDATTRALNYNSGTKTLTPAWATGEKVYAFNVSKNATLGGYLEAKSNGASATLEGDLTGTVEENNLLILIFPKSTLDYTGQNGTLAKVSSTYDYAYGQAKVTDVNGKKITAEDYHNGGTIQFENMQAIVKFTLLNKTDNSAIDATSLTINAKDGSDNDVLVKTYVFATNATTCGPITITSSPATNVIYAALSTTDPDGSYNYTLTATQGSKRYSFTKTGVKFERGKYYEITVNMTEQQIAGHGYVEMGDGLKWATCNIGATNPWDYGGYYSWGATATQTSYDWANYPHMRSGYSNSNYINKYTFACTQKTGIWYQNGTFVGDNGDGVEHRDFASYDYVDDAARQIWGGTWRIPTYAEWTALYDDTKFIWEWTNNYNGTGVKGYTVTSKVSGYTGNQIFLPVAGCNNVQGTNLVGEYGYYWSSSLGSGYSREAWYVYFYEDAKYRSSRDRNYGMSLRAVSE